MARIVAAVVGALAVTLMASPAMADPPDMTYDRVVNVADNKDW